MTNFKQIQNMKNKKIFLIFNLLIIILFISCKGKNEYSEESKALVLVRCNFTNLAIKYTDTKTDLKKEIDCLCYLDKIQKALEQRILSTPNGAGFKKPGSMNKKKTGYRGQKAKGPK